MTETAISSRDNPIFKRLKKLGESARARREARMTLLDGEHLLLAYTEAGGQPHTLVRAASFDAAQADTLAARCPQAKRIRLPDALFAELSPVATPSGVLAEAAWLAPAAPAGVAFVIVLEDIQDPGNLGAMLRTGAAAGATLAVLSRGCHDPWSPKALRGGQGAQFVLPMLLRVDLADWIQSANMPVWALALGGEQSVFELDLRGAVSIAVGNEGAGLGSELISAATGRAAIPMPGKVESLNAAVAGSIVLYRALAARRK